MTEKKNFKDIVENYKNAAKKRLTKCLFLLGKIYEDESKTKDDKKLALSFYEEGSEKGGIDSSKRLGDIFYYGEYGFEDIARAYQYYKKSARLGDDYSYFMARACAKKLNVSPEEYEELKKSHTVSLDGPTKVGIGVFIIIAIFIAVLYIFYKIFNYFVY